MASSDRLKGSLKRSLTNCRKLRKELSATKRELADTRKELDLALYARNTARDIARLLVESPLVKPAKSNPEDYIQLLKRIRRGVRDFVLTISRDMLDLLEDLVDGVGRDLSKADRPKLYSLILSCEALIPSIKQGLGYYDSKNMLISTEDFARVEKLERALEALKAELEKSSLGVLRKLGLRS